MYFVTEIFELERFNSRFLNEVNAKGIVNKLYFKKVIPQDIKTKIERANSDEEANVILYEHVQPQGVKASAKMLFEIMRDAVGYHKMNHLGAEMLECLIQGEYRMCVRGICEDRGRILHLKRI